MKRRLAARVTLVIAVALVAAAAIWWEVQTPEQRRIHIGERLSSVEKAVFPQAISIELADAPACGNPRQRVGCWLRDNREYIKAAAERFRIDRRAIGGLIAYEALLNVHVIMLQGLARWDGPGKVHYKEFRFSEGEPLAKQAEDRGMLPRRSMSQRALLLKGAHWSALYIAAIMRLFADGVRPYLKRDISCDPGALATLISAWSLERAQAHFAHRRLGTTFLAYNFAGNWVMANERFLTDQIGTPTECERPSRTTPKGK